MSDNGGVINRHEKANSDCPSDTSHIGITTEVMSMPSPYHKCAKDGCEKLVNPRAIYCKHHYLRTPEHIENQAKTRRGIKFSEEQRLKLSIAMKNAHIAKGTNSKKVFCLSCGVEFIAKPNLLKKGQGKYCSSKCAYKSRLGMNHRNWKGGDKEYTCDQCGTTFIRNPAHVKGREHLFCSRQCNSIFQMIHQKKKNTDIEIKMRELLMEKGILFQEQIGLFGISVVDFFIPLARLVIYCDGDYWHRLPEHLERDKRQTEILESKGLKVLRFWGKDIKKNPDKCLKAIRKYI